LTGLCGILWSSVYLCFSLSLASIPPFIYSAACFIGFIALLGINKFRLAKLEPTVFIFRQIQLILIFVLPVTMHIVLGGLNNSSASCVMSWSIIAPAGAIFYCNRQSSIWRAVGECAQALSQARDVLPLVLADRYVLVAIIAYTTVSIVVIAIDPLIPSTEPPPLLLRQVILRANCQFLMVQT
jgi:hypothetical protein